MIVGTPLAVTAACCCAATPPKLSVALIVIGLDPAVPSVSVKVASAAFTSVKVPDTVKSVGVPPTAAPFALAMPSTPLESVSVTLNVSLPVDPASEILIPEIVAILFTPTTVAAAGTVITGTVPAVTAMVLCAATLPKLSVALTLIESAPEVESVSLNVERSLLTTAKELVMVRLVVPSPVTVPPSSATLSSPWVSVKVTVTWGAPAALILPVSVTLTPLIAVAPARVTVAVVGAVMDGAPLTVIPTTCCVAELPKLSVAFSVSVSGLVVGSVSCRPPSELFTSPKSPLIVKVLPPLLDTTESEPEIAADSVPAVSDTTTVKVSGDPGLPLSERLRLVRGSLLPTPVVSEVGTVSTGTLFTVTAIFFTAAEPPRLSVAFTVIVSEPADVSRSASVPSAVFTALSEPVIVRV